MPLNIISISISLNFIIKNELCSRDIFIVYLDWELYLVNAQVTENQNLYHLNFVKIALTDFLPCHNAEIRDKICL